MPLYSMARTSGDISLLSWIIRWSGRVWQSLVSRAICREQWQVAYRACPRELDATGAEQFSVLRPPTGVHYADPFAFEWNDARYIFFERWEDGKNGEIWCVELDKQNQPGEPVRVLVRPYHLSFPYVFDGGGEIYMLPETSQNRTLELYRATEFPLRWERCTVLMDGNAVDSSIVKHEGLWWMFTSGLAGHGFKYSELSVLWADSPEGPWHAHPRNPVVCDVHCGRPAGAVFVADGELIRPGQDCSQGYGRGITLSRIDVLSKTEYRETAVKTIEPNIARDVCGVHTLNRSATLETLDFKLRIGRHRKNSVSVIPQIVKTPDQHGPSQSIPFVLWKRI
jgi:hypothetical protein